HGRAYAVEDSRDRLQIPQVEVERAERGDDDEVRQDECPTAGPRAPEAGTKVRNVDADLNGQRSRHGLTDRNGFAHLLLGHPLFVGYQFAFHLADQRDRAAEAEQAEPQEIPDDFADRAPGLFGVGRHADLRHARGNWVLGLRL